MTEELNSDLQSFQKIIEDVLLSINTQYQVRFKEFEDRLEKIEQQIATLVLAYGETSVFVEALVAQLAFASEDQQKSFTQNLAESRKTMLEVMQSAADGVVGSESPVIGSAISDMVEQKLSQAD